MSQLSSHNMWIENTRFNTSMREHQHIRLELIKGQYSSFHKHQIGIRLTIFVAWKQSRYCTPCLSFDWWNNNIVGKRYGFSEGKQFLRKFEISREQSRKIEKNQNNLRTFEKMNFLEKIGQITLRDARDCRPLHAKMVPTFSPDISKLGGWRIGNNETITSYYRPD